MYVFILKKAILPKVDVDQCVLIKVDLTNNCLVIPLSFFLKAIQSRNGIRVGTGDTCWKLQPIKLRYLIAC